MKIINIIYNKIFIIITSIIVGIIYYLNMSLSIPKDSNCSFSANIWTDILAFIGGFIVIYFGLYKYDEPILLSVGIIIIVEHIFQLFHNKI